jgi:hypothetical protein
MPDPVSDGKPTITMVEGRSRAANRQPGLVRCLPIHDLVSIAGQQALGKTAHHNSPTRDKRPYRA